MDLFRCFSGSIKQNIARLMDQLTKLLKSDAPVAGELEATLSSCRVESSSKFSVLGCRGVRYVRG